MAIMLESLDRLIEDGDGGKTELYQMLADDKAVDIVAVLDARFTLKGYSREALLAAYKRYAGYPLTKAERACLDRQRRKTQQRLVLA
jgi:hypothetical protein